MTTTIPAFDMNELMAFIAKQREEQAARNAKTREGLVALLTAQGVTQIEATYDAYGDSGNVENIDLTPDSVTLDETTDSNLRDLLWSVVYDLHPGFENNDGGDGEITWDLVEDTMSIDHRERFTDYNHYSHEGI